MSLPRWLVVLCIFVAATRGYPGGAPQGSCDDLLPRHGTGPQVSLSPYLLTPALQRVVEGNRLRLVLNVPEDETYTGYMIQARGPNGTGSPLGTFTVDSDLGKVLTCGAGIKNTLTHINNAEKNSLEVEWEPPANYEGPVVFRSTFVKDKGTFWVGVESDPIQVVKRSLGESPPGKGISTTKIPIRATTVPNYTPPRPVQKATTKAHEIYTGCGDQKLCFGTGTTGDCIADGDCTIAVSVSMSATPPNDFTFELLGSNSPGYVAVGLSNDANMGEDNVVHCTNTNTLGVSTNDGYSNNKETSVTGITLTNTKTDDGNLYCKFVRSKTTTVGDKTFDLGSTQYYLLLAKGSITSENNIRKHSETGATGSALSLTETGVATAKSTLLYRLHGAFMIAAWIGFAGTGMLLARYFKKTWVGTQHCGKDIWFAWHRGMMVLTWVLTCVAFIIIFVEVGDWYGETSNPHAVLGVITTALAFFQPFGAYLRPGPTSPKRPIFNWGHWLVGNLSHLLGIITIFFARQLSKAELPDWTDWIVSAYVAFHVVMHLLFSVTDCCSQREADNRVSNIPMKEMGNNARMNNFADTKRDAPQAGLRKFLLAIYLIVVCGLTVALIVIAVLAPIEKNETVKTVVNFLMPNQTN